MNALDVLYAQLTSDLFAIAKFLFHTILAFGAPVRGSPSEYCNPVWYGKTRMVGLPDGEKILRICITVYTQHRRVTDRQTDGKTDRRTDILPRHSPRYAYASRGNKIVCYLQIIFNRYRKLKEEVSE